MTNVLEGWRKPEDSDEPWAGYQVQTAPPDAVNYVLGNDVVRSQWVWIRLPDGDLVLAVYPQGDAYFSTEHWRSI